MRGAYLGRTRISTPGARERASFRQRNANRRTAPVWGAPRPPTSLGGRFTPQRGAWFRGANHNLCLPTLISSTRNIKPDIEMAPACIAVPEPLVPPRARNELCERAVEQASKSCLHCGVLQSREEVVLQARNASGRVPTLSAHNIYRTSPTACRAFSKARFDECGSVRGLLSRRGRNARNRSRQRE